MPGRLAALRGGRVVAEQRVYLTADRERAVPEGDPGARFLLCPQGGEVSQRDAARYGLLAEPAVQEEAPKSEEDAPVKAARRPPNKARRAAANASKDGAADKSSEKTADKSAGKTADKAGGGS